METTAGDIFLQSLKKYSKQFEALNQLLIYRSHIGISDI